MEIERRKYPRLNVSFPIECSDPAQKNYFYTVSKDISLGGVKIIYDKFLPKQTNLKLNINLIDNVVTAISRVCWCNKMRISDRYMIGLEFNELDTESKKNILNFFEKIEGQEKTS
ncbi:MAG: PilZ domain-containing protein [Candidatus Omnitrophica bacterium]|nr:PilZ domain-containing protein [Candidatus Omnitrophota bacterium]MCM8831597.1 PilZ domain-containing protein [Candidatus Omnitrophota bacterium]